MKIIIAAFAVLTLAGCNPQQQALVAGLGTIVVSDLCLVGDNQFAKIGNPSLAQTIAKAKLDAVCADPSTTSATLISIYNAFATKSGAPKAVATAQGPAMAVAR